MPLLIMSLYADRHLKLKHLSVRGKELQFLINWKNFVRPKMRGRNNPPSLEHGLIEPRRCWPKQQAADQSNPTELDINNHHLSNIPAHAPLNILEVSPLVPSTSQNVVEYVKNYLHEQTGNTSRQVLTKRQGEICHC